MTWFDEITEAIKNDTGSTTVAVPKTALKALHDEYLKYKKENPDFIPRPSKIDFITTPSDKFEPNLIYKVTNT